MAFSQAQLVSKTFLSGSGMPTTLTGVSNPASGQLLVAGLGFAASSLLPVVSLTDNASAGWAALPNSPFTYTGTSVNCWFWKVASVADSTTLTQLTFSCTNAGNQGAGNCWMGEWDGFIGTPTLDLHPAGGGGLSAASITITGSVPTQALELALGFLCGQNLTGASTGTNTYSPDNGTTPYTWANTHSAGASNTSVVTWAAPTNTPATASKFIITVTNTHVYGMLGATFYDKPNVAILPSTIGMTQAVNRAATF